MKIQVPDSVVKDVLRSGMPLYMVASVQDVIDEPEATYALTNGLTRFDGQGMTVVGKVDRSGKFLKISRIRLDKGTETE